MRKRSQTTCFLALLLLLTGIGCYAKDNVSGLPLYPKLPPPPTSLVVVDLRNDSIEGQIAACVLQGIVNRAGGEMVYVLNAYATEINQQDVSQDWIREGLFKDIKVEYLNGVPDENPGFTALLQHDKRFAKGLIIYDRKLVQATIEAATTIAGQTDGIGALLPALGQYFNNADNIRKAIQEALARMIHE